MAFSSCFLLLLGAAIAGSGDRVRAREKAHRELFAGSLLAAGLMLIGVGIEASAC